MRQLEGRWALVTGSSRGIGRQIAVGLAEHGCKVIVHGRTTHGLAETLASVRATGGEAHGVAGELDSDAGVQSVIDSVRDAAGHVDILYNNAAIQTSYVPLWDIPMDDWRKSFQVNLYAPAMLCRAFAPEMRRRGFGRIVNLTSGIKDIPQLAPYSASKAAIDKYTRDLAHEMSGSNVIVSALDPGWLKTDMGGPNAMFAVEDVLPGALVPALLLDGDESGKLYHAQSYRGR